MSQGQQEMGHQQCSLPETLNLRLERAVQDIAELVKDKRDLMDMNAKLQKDVAVLQSEVAGRDQTIVFYAVEFARKSVQVRSVG